ncbi:MAG TPA: RDD family protein, partial [Candidatus Tenderia sp.]|nr:RDD family protein [Candidatus Tenderia sp.]
MTLLDTRYTIETPEGIDLALCPAGPVPRALAYLVDFLLRAAILVALFFLTSWAGGLGEAGML